MRLRWDVDDATVVELKTSLLGNDLLTVNGREIPSRLGISELPFELADGRRATIVTRPRSRGRSIFELRVDGRLMVPTGKTPIRCGGCGARVTPNDRRCGSCGQSLPSPEEHVRQRRLREAPSAIWTLATLCSIGGVFLFFLLQSKRAAVLAMIEGMDPQSVVSIDAKGLTIAASALRARIIWERWGVVIATVLLVMAMAGLAKWAKHAPRTAFLICIGIYYGAIIVALQAIGPVIFAASAVDAMEMTILSIGFLTALPIAVRLVLRALRQRSI